jgi:glutaredoxin
MSLAVYSLKGCPYSMNTEKLLKKYKMKHELFKVGQSDKARIKKKTGMNTFPQIFYKKHVVGGNDELEQIIDLFEKIKDYDSNMNLKQKKLYKKYIEDCSKNINLSRNILGEIMKLINKKP